MKGEDKCPLKDERESLEMKIKQADGVIFATPVYTFNVSWIMKNFLDRFAYRCHRPDFYRNKIMVVTTTGGVGLGFVNTLLSLILGTMGYITCAKAGVTFPPSHEKDEEKLSKEMKKLQKETEKFYEKLNDTKPVKPSFMKRIEFIKQKQAFSKAPQDLADYRFWREKGWFEKDSWYYYDAPINPIIKRIVSINFQGISANIKYSRKTRPKN
jgi:Multimeric flavodoxin WrbA